VPRITGPDIATHVATQERIVLATAIALFSQRGYAEVSMGDIAEAVGLARTSLYRYFPDKDHILLAWLRRDMADLLERSDAIAADARGLPDPWDRLSAWIGLMVHGMATPEHAGVMSLAGQVPLMGAELRSEVAAQHGRLSVALARILADAMRSRPSSRRVGTATVLVAGLLRSAAELLGRGADPATVHHDVGAAASATARAL
jgi:AcrR family transcriptional regulator